MAYDDDDSKFDWRDYVTIANILEQYVTQPGRLTIPQLAELVNTVHALSRGRGSGDVSIAEVSEALHQAGFGNVPIGVVDQVVRAAAELPPDVEAADRITLAQARRIIGRREG
jgi:hypothetical protein